jgi:hypothetical protein
MIREVQMCCIFGKVKEKGTVPPERHDKGTPSKMCGKGNKKVLKNKPVRLMGIYIRDHDL